MLDLYKKYKLVIYVGVVVLFIILVVSLIQSYRFRDYIKVSNKNDLYEEVNSNFFLTNKGSFSEEEYVRNLSNSFGMGYLYLSNYSLNKLVSVKELSDEEISWLTYFILTSGNDAVCFKKSFFEEMVSSYLGVNDFKLKKSIDGIVYRPISRKYCFEHSFFDYISRMELKSYQVNGDIIELYYEEVFDEEISVNNRKWIIKFKRESYPYKLMSVYLTY